MRCYEGWKTHGRHERRVDNLLETLWEHNENVLRTTTTKFNMFGKNIEPLQCMLAHLIEC